MSYYSDVYSAEEKKWLSKEIKLGDKKEQENHWRPLLYLKMQASARYIKQMSEVIDSKPVSRY